MFLVVINFPLINFIVVRIFLHGQGWSARGYSMILQAPPHSDQYQISPNNITVISIERSRERMKSLALMKCPDV